MFQTINAVLISVTVSSCGGGDNKTDTLVGDTATKTKSEPRSVVGANQSGTTGATVALVKAMVDKDWKAVDGQEVTITAYPVGLAKAGKNGKFYLYLADSPGGGNMNFAASFKEEMRAEVRIHKGDAMMTVTGNISTPNGIIALKNVKIVE